MSTEKKSSGLLVAIIAIIIIIAIIWIGRSSSGSPSEGELAATSSPVPVSETSKVSGSLMEYQNAELGFSVKYPNTWEKEEANSGVDFVVPIGKDQVTTVNSLHTNVSVVSGTCTFPAVTTVKDRATVKYGDFSFNTISMTNTVQGRTYFDRMYSLQQGSVCYMFRLSSITQSLASKNLTGSQATQATNNNKAIINTTDTAFTEMVKSFKLVTGPQGEDETKAAPAKK